MLLLLAKRELCSLLHHHPLLPRCVSSSATETSKFTIVDYLITAVGFSPDKAARASKPIAHLKSPDKPDSVRRFLNQQGFSEADIKKIITWFPQILYSSPQNTIDPNLRALRNTGLSASALTQIILSNPAALVLRSAVPRIMFWRDFLEGDEAALVKSFTNSSGLVTHDISRIIAPKMSLLQSHGLSTADVRKMVCNVPQFFCHSISLMEDRLKRAEELGFHPDSKTFLIALEAMVRVNRQTFQKKMDLLKSFGWSEDEFHSALRKSPTMVTLSEKNLQAKMDFFLVEARCSISYISARPNLLFLSLEKRLRPRLRVLHLLESKGLGKPHKANDSRWEAIQVVRARDGALGLSHFKLLRRLGCGDIGSVYLSELSGTKCYFAMKVMDKASLAGRKKLLRAQTEREILQCLDHPFLPTLYTHFETDKFSCLVMEFCPGGDLHSLRQRQPGKYFSEQAVKFYVAEVLLAMEYLHMLGIIYRDLKPENVLVREDGHIMLSDFDLSLQCTVSPTFIRLSNSEASSLGRSNTGYCVQPTCIEPSCIQPSCVVSTSCFSPRFFSSKSKKDRKPKSEIGNQVTPLPELIAEPTDARSMSFVGTHEYLAPEIISGKGHGSAVDWWTFGIFLYELLFGKTPFKGSGNRATLFNVVGQPLRFPESPLVSFSARDLIRGLLMKEPQHRLGYKRGATEIKQHPFFEGVNWALIRCASPPDVPKPVEIERSQVAPGAMNSKSGAAPADQKGPDNYLEFEFF